MKFLADEDFPKPLVIKIRNLGFLVKTIQQKNLQGSSDEVVSNLALKEKRIVLTFDKGFLKNKQEKLTIILFQFPRIPTSDIIPLIENFLVELKNYKLTKGKIIKFNKQGLTLV